LNGIYLHRTASGLLAACATDGYTLIKKTTTIQIPELRGLIVPNVGVTHACDEIAKLGKNGLTLRISNKLIEARTEGHVLVSKLIDATFPDFQRVIPARSTIAAECDRAELVAALARIHAVAEDDPVAGLAWGDDEISLCIPKNPEIASDFVPATATSAGRLAAAPHRLISILDAIDGERIMLDVASEASPIRITPVGDESLLALVMPCKW
jgi:DNA polymerase-3 subunit beta